MPIKLQFPLYAGSDRDINALQDFLQRTLRPFGSGAYLHGSAGCGDTILYSDVDALFVLNERTCRDPRKRRKALRFLSISERFFYRFDPLQHHGWFILKSTDLQSYPEHLLPVEVLRRAVSLFPDIGREMEIDPIFQREKVRANFHSLARGVRNKLASRRPARNLFVLKGLLSQFMLLPTLYLQARNGRGFHKKESFGLARREFSASQWSVMDEVSEIRLRWQYRINAVQRFLLTRTGRLRTYCARYMPIDIPGDIRSRLTPEFFRRMDELVAAMEARLKP